METKLFLIKKEGERDVYLSNCKIIDGYLARAKRTGIGNAREVGGITSEGEGWSDTVYDNYETTYIPLFNSAAIGENINKNELTKLSMSEAINQHPKLLFKLGENTGGKVLWDKEEYDLQKTLSEKKVLFTWYDCWETGLRFYCLKTRVPREIFNMLELEYHSEEIEEEGDWKGWYFVGGSEPRRKKLKEIGWDSNL